MTTSFRGPCVLSILLTISACATSPREFETPRGSEPGSQPGPWIILGVISQSTSTLNRSDAQTMYAEQVTVDVPVGTEIIVPAVRGWTVGYGAAEPEDLSVGGTYGWYREDHHLGVALLNVEVIAIQPPDNTATPPTQSATIEIDAVLTDWNSDDRWFGAINYTLICLGRHP